MARTIIEHKLSCYHCGESCDDEPIQFDNKVFCCQGCKLVFELLQENNLCNYYDLSSQPGNQQKNAQLGSRFEYLDEQDIQQRLIRFQDENSVHLRFHIPNMHCSSCIWLLEHLDRLDKGVQRSQVDFIQKEILIVFEKEKTTVRKIVELLSSIGYEPELNLEQLQEQTKKKKSHMRIYRIGVAGFAFGNIMLLSFPEYFSRGIYSGEDFRTIFGYLNLLLATPTFIFSGGEFLSNAWKSVKQRSLNIDVPIAIGIIAMFLRSSYEILSGTGAGYFDSMTGLIFFMLIGRNFQDNTFDWLSFDRDFKSYFPIAVSRLIGSKEEHISVSEIKVNDRLLIRNMEIIPADVLLVNDVAEVDYSFVTGESNPVTCRHGERIFAGGRLVGSTAEVLVQQEVSQSYLTQLWNQVSSKTIVKSKFQQLVEVISRWFIIVTIAIAAGAFLYWYQTDMTRAIQSFTAVLVIACPCALALSAPFTFGNMLRILGKKGVYLKNAGVIERLSDINAVLFDKTGTLTKPDAATISYTGRELSSVEKTAIQKIAAASSHPLSQMIAGYLKEDKSNLPSENVKEFTGKGIEGTCNQVHVQLGNSAFAGDPTSEDTSDFLTTRIYVRINNQFRGYFAVKNLYRDEISSVTDAIKNSQKELFVISGDNESERTNLEILTGQLNGLHFNQTPTQKLNFVKEQQGLHKKVLMVGDGLNDAGALLQSEVGLTISSNINNFSPACDGILLEKNFSKIPALLRFSESGIRIIIISFIISIVYNVVGLGFAVQGNLSPVIAAILMPISTTSLVVYTVVASSLKARSLKL